MEKNHGKYLVVAAVFCLVPTFTSAAVLGEECTGPGVGDCTGTGVICNQQCVCDGSYKPNTENTMCIRKVVGDPCTDHADCNAEDTNSECSTETQRKCKCKTGFTAINNVCKRGLGDPCEDHTECNAVSNAECVGADGSEVCTCKANYKQDNGQCSSANGIQTLLSAPIALLLSFLMVVVTRLH